MLLLKCALDLCWEMPFLRIIFAFRLKDGNLWAVLFLEREILEVPSSCWMGLSFYKTLSWENGEFIVKRNSNYRNIKIIGWPILGFFSKAIFLNVCYSVLLQRVLWKGQRRSRKSANVFFVMGVGDVTGVNAWNWWWFLWNYKNPLSFVCPDQRFPRGVPGLPS